MQHFYDAICGTELNWVSCTVRLLLSMLLGSLIGMERKRKGQMAGIRTFALISMGATLAMLLSIYVPQEYLGLKNGDPGRIAAQVITGIGFLGAGTIIQMKGSVRGLTTVAGIWIVAIVGMAVGVGMYLIAVITTALVLFVLLVLENIERRVNVGSESRIIRLKLTGVLSDIAPYAEVLKKHQVVLTNYYVEYDYQENTTRLNLIVLLREHSNLIEIFKDISALGKTIAISISNQASIT